MQMLANSAKHWGSLLNKRQPSLGTIFAWSLVFFCIPILPTALANEVQVQFDGKEWVFPEGYDELTEEELEGGICFTADANVPAGIALKELGLNQLLTHPVRFALRGQEGEGAKFDPLPADMLDATNVIAVFCGEGKVFAASLSVDNAAGCIHDDSRFGGMSDDFEGLEDFLGSVKAGVKKSEAAKEIPRVDLSVRSKTSFGMVVRLIQLIRSAGCKSGLVRVDDDFPSLNIEVLVKPDVNVVPPVVKFPKGEPSGSIIVNVHADGTLADAKNRVLADDAEVEAYVEQERRRLEAEGFKPKLHLRGDSDSVFKHARNVIRRAANAGVDQVVFGSYRSPDHKTDDFLKAHEPNPKMHLPKREEPLPNAAANEARVIVEITIDAENRISWMDEKGFLDTDPEDRDLPLLLAKLEAANQANDLTGKKLGVLLRVDPNASQNRVIDALNVLATLEINAVYFAELETDNVGGLAFTLRVQPNVNPDTGEKIPLRKKDMTLAIQTIEKRLNALGISDMTTALVGEDSISLELSGMKPENADKIRSILKKVGKLEFRPVNLEGANPSGPNGESLAEMVFNNKEIVADHEAYKYVDEYDGEVIVEYLLLKSRPIIDSRDIDNAYPQSRGATHQVGIILTDEGGEKMFHYTKDLAELRDRMAVLLDGEVIIAPGFREVPLRKNFVIDGQASFEEASVFASQLNNPLKNKLIITKEHAIDPKQDTAAETESVD